MKKLPRTGSLILTFGLLSLTSFVNAEPTGRPTRVIQEAIDETKLVTLQGNTRPEANALNDRGRVPDDFQLDHMLLQLKRSPEREAALKQYIEELHDSTSPNFHHWLTASEFTEHYGVAKEDVDTVTAWLKQRGFTVHGAQASGLAIDFSGTAGMVRSAYHTEIHNLEVDGKNHFANFSDPKIPAALEPAVAGIVSLHNFHPKPLLVPRNLVPRGQYTYTNPNGTFYALVPGDINTIYNIHPAFDAGYTGLGQAIMVIEDTFLYSKGDWSAFRTKFGLDAKYPYASLTEESPRGALTCYDPGFQGKPGDPGYGDDAEAALDVEWSTAAAPNAAIVLAACTDSSTTFGGLVALENVLNGPTYALPSVVSISYGEAEAYNGAAANLAYSSAFQQGVAEGVSIFVSSGDEDAASADGGNPSTHGIGVSGFTSTPYNVSVGGLDFGFVPDHVPPSTYFSSTNRPNYSSALSYVQEIPWNDSCASSVFASFFGTTPLIICNSSAVDGGSLSYYLNAVGGSGGPSGCATGVASIYGTVSGTCAGYPKPDWQKAVPGNPSDGVRDIPDVALFASNGIWSSYYVACWTNPNPYVGGGYPPCASVPPSEWSGWGGTSISSPIMAAIQALVNEKTGSRWGNPNTVYYALARAEYEGAGLATCNSNTVAKIGSACIFYDITQGDNDGACTTPSSSPLRNCYKPSTLPYGVLSLIDYYDEPAYPATPGWDFTSGIGSVNAWNLISGWPSVP
jgi:subtilase family serine protease